MIGRFAVVAATVAAAAVTASVLAAPSSAAAASSTALRVGSVLRVGSALHSPDGRYTATLRTDGQLVIDRGRTYVWTTGAKGAHAQLVLRSSGDLVITSGAKILWSTSTAGSRATSVVLGNDGALAVRSSGGLVWSDRIGNGCRTNHDQRVIVNLTKQFARLCAKTQQVLTTPITSGATAKGDGTPTGTWHLQAKIRNTTLYPAGGGAYPVHYWMPYDGAYGMHDSPWQRFAYGSAKYRTQGSHGCVHFPRAAIAWMFAWARIGTTVHIRY